MYLRYGSYSHAQGEVTLSSITRNAVTGDNGIVTSIKEQWILDGRLQVADTGNVESNQAAVSSAVSGLKAAYKLNKQDIGFYTDGGVLTSHSIKNNETIFGVRIASLQFPEGRGAEHSTFRSYRIVVEADFVFQSNEEYTAWNETIAFSGTGGATFGLLQPLTGYAQPQLLTESSPCYAVQSGRAARLKIYPVPGGPIWGAPPEHVEQRQISYGVSASDNNMRSVDWTYVFEAPGPLTGYPRYRSF